MKNIHPDHLIDLKESGLSTETIEKAGIKTVPQGQISKIFGWNIPIDSLLAFPYPATSFVRYKLFPPYKKKGEKRAQKYFQEPDTSPHLYFPPNLDRNADVILFTEGEKKALKAVQEGISCIGLGGIWDFAVKDGSGNPQLIDDFDSIEWIDRKVELVPDSDFQKKPEVKQAVYRFGTMLEERGANVSVVCLPTSGNIGKIDDYLCGHSIDEYKKLKRVPLKHGLFSEVKKREKKTGKQPEKHPEKPSIVEDIESWETPVKGCELLNDLYAVIKKHIILTHNALVAIALWIVLTYCYDSFRILPKLAITSPEKRCGKTTLLEILDGLANKALLASNITPSAIFRTIEKHRPCLLIDEADTFLKDNNELRGILNSGHTKKSAFVIRTNPETLEPERFSTWGPQAISLIGALPDTISDRSIAIKMERKTVSEKVQKVSIGFDENHLPLRCRCKRWANDNAEILKNATPEIPETGNDRATDNWLPLICIADLAGGDWPEMTRKAMRVIEKVSEEDTIKQILLRDIKTFFDECDKISSKELVRELIAIEDHPWGDWKQGKPITQNGLARLLKPFGILSKTIRIGESTSKGYTLEQFTEAFNRYLPHISPIQSVTTSQLTPVKDLRDFKGVTRVKDVTDVNQRKPTPAKECCVVADKKGGTLQQTEIFLTEADFQGVTL
ncbi:MAG: DUF3631 domain-containing protein [Smithella sp.]